MKNSAQQLALLNQKIERKRARMHAVVEQFGFNHPCSIRVSQSLDDLLNQHYKLKHAIQYTESEE